MRFVVQFQLVIVCEADLVLPNSNRVTKTGFKIETKSDYFVSPKIKLEMNVQALEGFHISM